MDELNHFFSFDIYTTIAIVVAVIVSIPITKGCFQLSNKAPAKWFCDYDETPTDEMLNGIRFRYNKFGLLTNLVIAIAYVGIFATYHLSVYSILLCIIATVLMLITMSDIKYKIIPDEFTIAVGALCLGAGLLDYFTSQIFIDNIWFMILGGVSGFILPILINLLSKLLFKKDGIGFGDVKLLGVIGLLFGFPYIFAVIIIAVFVALAHIIYLFLRKKADDMYMPFGPYIAIGSVILLVFLQLINVLISLYIGLLT